MYLSLCLFFSDIIRHRRRKREKKKSTKRAKPNLETCDGGGQNLEAKVTGGAKCQQSLYFEFFHCLTFPVFDF